MVRLALAMLASVSCSLAQARFTDPPHVVPRQDARGAVDATTGALYLLGGRADRLLDLWRLQNGVWQKVVDSPFAGAVFGLAHDPVRQRLVASLARDGGQGGLYEFDGLAWQLVLPLASPDAQLVYDPVRQVVLVWAWGYYGSTLRRWNGSSLTYVPPAGLPLGTLMHGTVGFDTARGRAVVIASNSRNVYEWDGSLWTTIAVPSNPYGPITTTDPVSGSVIAVTSGMSTMAQAWTGSNWVPWSLAGLPTRYKAVFAGNSVRQVCQVVGGGYPFNAPHADTWENPGGNWQQVTADTACPAFDHPKMVATGPGTALLFDGGDGYAGLPKTVRFQGGTWTLLQPAHSPSPRSGFALAGDVDTGQVFLFGGESGSVALADFWRWDGADWQQLPSGPSARSQHGLCFRADARRVVLYGGLTNNETWEWDGSTWVLRSANFPPHAGESRLDYHAVRQRTVLTTHGLVGLEVWEWDGNNWFSTNPPSRPALLGSVSTTYDPVRESIVLVDTGTTYPAPGQLGIAYEWDGNSWSAFDPTERLRSVAMTTAGVPDHGVVALNVLGGFAVTLTHDHPASATGFGTACPDPARRLTATQPWLGRVYRLRYPLDAGGVCVFATGFSNASTGGLPLPLDLGFVGLPGCSLLVAADLLAFRTGLGAAELALPLPSSPALAGSVFFQQAAGLTSGLTAVSQGLAVTVGSLW